MAEAIVDLLEAVHVGDHHGQRRVVALAARQFTVEFQEERTRIGQAGKVVGSGRVLRLLVLECVLDRERHLAGHCQNDTQVIGGECIALAAIESQNADHATNAFQGNGQGGAQCAELGGIVQVSRFDGRVPVHDGLFVMGDPAGKSLADRDTQRGKEPVVVSIHVFGNEFVVAQNVNGDGVVRHHRLELNRENRERLTQAERSTQTLAQLEECLRFLACGGDGGKERGFASDGFLDCGFFETRSGSFSSFDLDFSREG